MARSTTFKYTVTVVSSGGNKYAIDGNTQQYVVLFPGCTYEFNQDDSSNATHPLRFATQIDAANSSQYTTGVTTSGTPGSATAFTKIEVTGDTPFVLYYYCSSHSGMGGSINVPNNIQAAGSGDMGIFMGGQTPSASNVIDYVSISTAADAADFGDLIAATEGSSAFCDGTSAYFACGSTDTDGLEIFNIASKGNTVQGTNLTTGRQGRGNAQSNVRGLAAGGAPGPSANIDFFTFKSADAGGDFGDLTHSGFGIAGCSSPTRGIFMGGSYSNVMDYVTISTLGNATDFGDYQQAVEHGVGLSSNTRGIFAGGQGDNPYPFYNDIGYITIASTGNTTDFGNLQVARSAMGGVSNNTKGVMGGGGTPIINTIDVITIASTADASDFGDLTTARQRIGATGNGIGGLQ